MSVSIVSVFISIYDFSSSDVIYEWFCLYTLYMFLKNFKILLYFLYLMYPGRIRILAFQKFGGYVSISVSW